MASEQRPKINLEWEQADWLLEGLALASLLMLVLLPAAYYSDLPEIIPQHFNARGEADGFGHKSMLWFMPALGAGLYGLLTVLNRWPHIFNYPVRITEENAEQQYRLATRLIRILKVAVLLLFAFITWGIIKGASAEKPNLDAGFMWVITGSLAGITGWYMFTAYRKK